MGISHIDSGDTAWMLASTIFVLLMTIPGLALFYAGMVRRKNILSTMAQSFGICCIVSLLWFVIGYSLAFSGGNAWIGNLAEFCLMHITSNFHQGIEGAFTLGNAHDHISMMIPKALYVLFQMSFAIIAPALITGAFAERIKFSALCIFTILWSLLVYVPIAHWVWSPLGWLHHLGAIDFAGGTVVHINAGVAGLVCALMLGRRRGWRSDDMTPHNLTYAIIGASLLWVGWFGFNGGSALGANGLAALSILTTQVAAAAGGVAWMIAEYIILKRSTALGLISGAISGLVAITPAAGYVLPWSAALIGLMAGIICFLSVTVLKYRLNYDDSLDVFGIHGVGGIVGALLTGVFSYGPLSATAEDSEGIKGGVALFIKQIEAVGATILWSVVLTAIIIWCVDKMIGMRVSDEEEQEGLDLTQHGERLN